MLTTADAADVTPKDRRTEVAAIRPSAFGGLRAADHVSPVTLQGHPHLEPRPECQPRLPDRFASRPSILPGDESTSTARAVPGEYHTSACRRGF